MKDLDLLGIGKVMEELPDEAIIQTTDTINTCFKNLIYPLTAATKGLGLYIEQKFDQKINMEKALGIYAIQNAVAKAKNNQLTIELNNPKSFISIVDEASREIDPLLHKLWTNLLTSEITNKNHPSFIRILQKINKEDAMILQQLTPHEEVKNSTRGFLGKPQFDFWVIDESEHNINPYNLSCDILYSEGLIDFKCTVEEYDDNRVVMTRTKLGTIFLNAVKE